MDWFKTMLMTLAEKKVEPDHLERAKDLIDRFFFSQNFFTEMDQLEKSESRELSDSKLESSEILLEPQLGIVDKFTKILDNYPDNQVDLKTFFKNLVGLTSYYILDLDLPMDDFNFLEYLDLKSGEKDSEILLRASGLYDLDFKTVANYRSESIKKLGYETRIDLEHLKTLFKDEHSETIGQFIQHNDKFLKDSVEVSAEYAEFNTDLKKIYDEKLEQDQEKQTRHGL